MFEITDFTSASDWERFIGAVTELLHEWKAVEESAAPGDDGPPTPAPAPPQRPTLRQADVDFAGTKFAVTPDCR